MTRHELSEALREACCPRTWIDFIGAIGGSAGIVWIIYTVKTWGIV